MRLPVPPAWADAIDEWLSALRAAARPATTLLLRREQMGRVARGVAPVGPWELSGPELRRWAGEQNWSPETRRSFRAAMRSFYGWAMTEGLVDVDASLALPAVRPPEPCPRPTPEQVIDEALAGASERVRLMIRLAAELGLRRGEVAQVNSGDLDRDLTGWTLLVHGKGGKLRRLPMSPGLAAAVRLAMPPGGGWLFPGNDGHLSAHHVGVLVSRVLPEGWTMHTLRHRFATLAYSHERDMFMIQDLLGHSSPVTTRRYVRLPTSGMRATVEAVGRTVV